MTNLALPTCATSFLVTVGTGKGKLPLSAFHLRQMAVLRPMNMKPGCAVEGLLPTVRAGEGQLVCVWEVCQDLESRNIKRWERQATQASDKKVVCWRRLATGQRRRRSRTTTLLMVVFKIHGSIPRRLVSTSGNSGMKWSLKAGNKCAGIKT